jgi:trehalose/maltose hydrolase-like predicted phosphorylase
VSSWTVGYDGYDPAVEGIREALCTLGNGYLATRGAAPEAAADAVRYPGTYLAGCYDRLTSHVAGRNVENEDLVNVPNWLPLTFRIDGGDWFDPARAELLSYRQELDMRHGVLSRRLRFQDGDGRLTSVTQQRLVSMDDPHLAAVQTVLVPENWSGRVEIRSALDGRVTNAGVARYRSLNSQHLAPHAAGEDRPDTVWLTVETATSHIRLAQAARTRVTGGGRETDRTLHRQDRWVAHELTVDAAHGVPVGVEKVVAIFSGRDRAIADCTQAARTWIRRAPGFDELERRHTLAWDRLWRRARLEAWGTDGMDVQRVVNLQLFHLLQVVGPHTIDLDVGVPARGLHGEAYRGHVFWDELFVFRFLAVRFPELARALLLYRYRRLPEARVAASEAGYSGSMYPWQSGSDGREETQRLHLNPRSGRWLPDSSHLQRHVGIAIAYNVWQYYQATADLEFLSLYGAEMLLEIARFWAGAAVYSAETDRYEICGVMGPDEYHDGYPDAETPGIDNNAYTNVMASWVLRRALDALRLLPAHLRRELCERLDLGGAEIDRMAQVSRRIRVVFHGDGIISQFEGYEKLAELDWAGYRAKYGDIRRLDRILEAEGDTTNRYQVSKQADVLMLCYLLSAEELEDALTRLGYPIGPETIPRTVEYYLARTSHGSTLSAVVHAWVLARHDRPRSWPFFLEALNSDFRDLQGGTTAEGIHLGAMAGVLDIAQRCYTGLETRDDVLRLNPQLPAELPELVLDLHYRGHSGIEVHCDHRHTRVRLRDSAAAAITVAVGEQTATVEPGETWQVPRS